MGNEHLTSKGIIHHSKNGTHIVSAKDPKDEIKIMMLNLNEAGKFWNFLCFVDENCLK